MRDLEFSRIEKVNTLRPSMPDDLFVSASSFEPRVLKTVSKFDNYQTRHCVIFRYEDGHTKKAEEVYLNALKRRLDSVTLEEGRSNFIHGRLRDPQEPMQKFRDMLDKMGCVNPCITVDITCFTKLYLIILLDILMEKVVKNKGILRLLYAEPKEYASERRQRLSWGCQEIKHLSLFNGSYITGKRLLILFGGHEGEREVFLWEDDEPDFTILIIEKDERKEEWDILAEEQHKYLIQREKAGDPTILIKYVSSLKPDELANELFNEVEELYKKKGYTNIWITPLGSKTETVAIQDFTSRLKKKMKMPPVSVQIVYPVPEEYNTSAYSKGTGRMWKWEYCSSTLSKIKVNGEGLSITDPFDLDPSVLVGRLDFKTYDKLYTTVYERYGEQINQKIIETKAKTLVVYKDNGELKVAGKSNSPYYPSDDELEKIQQEVGKVCYVVGRDVIEESQCIEESNWTFNPQIPENPYPAIPIYLGRKDEKYKDIIRQDRLIIADFDTGNPDILAFNDKYRDSLLKIPVGLRLRREIEYTLEKGKYYYDYYVNKVKIALCDSQDDKKFCCAEFDVLFVLNWQSSPFTKASPLRNAFMGRALWAPGKLRFSLLLNAKDEKVKFSQVEL
ncbi:MAG: hypothetical protein AB1630_08495 [bacterium]